MLLTQVGDCVEQGHVGASYHRVAHLGMEAHLGHEHTVHKHLKMKK